MPLDPRLRVQLFDSNLASPTLIDDLSNIISSGKMETALHGGFRKFSFDLAMGLSDAWAYLHEVRVSGTFGQKGRHFARVLVTEQIGTTIGTLHSEVVWEGRIMEVTLRITPNFHGLAIVALGYWSACRDQRYSATDHTNWATGGPHTTDDIIKEMLTQECPDINSDQAGIAANSRDVVGLDLTDRSYPMDVIVDQLGTISDSDDSTWHFAIWEDRKPYWTKRAITDPDWMVWLRGEGAGVSSLMLRQDAKALRNAIMPIDNTTEGTVATDAASLVTYPRRELPLTVPTGSSANVEADAAQAAANERGFPRQTQSFLLDGHVFHTPASGGIQEAPKWRIRAGDTIRVQDLVPASASSALLDSVRTFHILGTVYNMDQDVMTVQPDTYKRSLGGLLARQGNVEKVR